jgi:hypothetical protein
MRLAIFGLLLSAGTAAFCQSAAPAPGNAQQPWLVQPGLPEGGRDFTKLARDWHMTSLGSRKMFVLPKPSPHLDSPQIVVHPPRSSVGEQPTGPLLAQNLYPGLQLMPIVESKAKGEPIPTTWPNARIKQIPTVWPKLEFNTVQSGANKPSPGK